MTETTEKIILVGGHQDGLVTDIPKGHLTIMVSYVPDSKAVRCGPNDPKPKFGGPDVETQVYYRSNDWDEGKPIFTPWMHP